MKKKITGKALLKKLENIANQIKDPRKKKSIYSIKSLICTAFSLFFLQKRSFRSHENDIKNFPNFGKNFAKIFKTKPIQNANTVKNILDCIHTDAIAPLFDQIFHSLDRSAILSQLKVDKQFGILVSGDGVEYFSSSKIHCRQCTKKEKKSGTQYSHQLFAAAIVKPGLEHIFQLKPEFLSPQDGTKKQDCEQKAAQRWVKKWRSKHKTVQTTFLGDALHGREPFIRLLIKERFHFVISCKQGSNKTVFEWVEDFRKREELNKREEVTKKNNKRIKIIYEYVNEIPLTNSKESQNVNFIEIKELEEETNKEIAKFSYITDVKITEENYKQIANIGRSRWKSENEGNNVLKNHGYHLERNYGHGQKYLSANMAQFALLAHIIHTIQLFTKQELSVSIQNKYTSRREYFCGLLEKLRQAVYSSLEDLYDQWKQALFHPG